MDETSILQSVCSCIGGQQNVSRVLSSGNKRYLMVKDASAVDLTQSDRWRAYRRRSSAADV